MPNPIGDSEDTAFLEKSSDLKFFRCRILGPTANVVSDLKRRHMLVAISLECLESDGTVPFLFAHRQKFFRRIEDQRDILEEENVGVASKGDLVR